MMTQARHCERVPFFARVTITPAGGGSALDAHSFDISLGGVGLISPRALATCRRSESDHDLSPGDETWGSGIEATIRAKDSSAERLHLIRKSSLEKCEPRDYAIAHLTGLPGDDAANVLCELVRQGDDAIAAEAMLAMRDVSVKAGIPPLLTLLREGPPCSLDAVVECLEWKGAASKAAIPDLVKLIETEPRTRKPLWTQQLAAMALGKLGPDAAPALPALIRLAERHAPEEWNRLKNHPPRFVNPFDRRARMADDDFVDAILRIRRN
jgi:hypothetical protein